MRAKANEDRTVGVYLTSSSTGGSVVGVLPGEVAVTVLKPTGATVDVAVTGASWAEVTAGAFAGTGFYRLTLLASALDTPGLNHFMVAVPSRGCDPFPGILELVSNTEDDAVTAVAEVGDLVIAVA
jgi:hypothetical protein